MTARHLRIVPPAERARTSTADEAKAAVLTLNRRHALELIDALAELGAAHRDPVAAAADLIDLRQNALDLVDQVFAQLSNRQRCAQ